MCVCVANTHHSCKNHCVKATRLFASFRPINHQVDLGGSKPTFNGLLT